uniref:portal protein n=1 Tax=Methylobacterium sp. B34 TaxID=95563 RepID=UPI000349A63D|nr:hypothetical protein [Methylobacterium sp. B34]
MQDKPFKDEEIRELVARKIRQSVGVYDSQLSKERENVLKFYNQELPRRQHAGGSSYVSSTVYDTIQSMKAQLLDVFADGREIVSFDPQNAEDVEPARIATAYVNYVVSRQNDPHRIFSTVIEDGLKARVGVVKVYWDVVKKYNDKEFEGVDANAVLMASAMPEVSEVDADVDPLTGTASGVITVVEDDSQVRIDTIAPENFGVEPEAACLVGAFHYHRVLKTRAEIKAMGLDTKKLKDKQPDAGSTASQDVETVARFRQIDTGYNPRDVDSNGQFWLYECYVYRDVDDRRRLYKVMMVSDVVLDVEEVDRSPFIVFTPLPVAHSFWGDSMAKRAMPNQTHITGLTRGILDHTAITTNPRYLVAAGGLSKPSELLDNRLGGIVNVSSIDAVAPIQQPQLNPFTLQAIQMLQANNEATTGITALSQGLDKDVISNQNSSALINQMMDAGATRSNAIAREFAYTFLKPLYQEVYRLVLENEERPQIAAVAGNWVDVDIKSWVKNRHCTVTLHFTPADAQAKAGQYVQLLSLAAQNPQLSAMITAENYYNIGARIMGLMDIKDIQTVFTHPSQIPPKQPDPVMVAQMQIAQQQAQAGMMAPRPTCSAARPTPSTGRCRTSSPLSRPTAIRDQRNATPPARMQISPTKSMLRSVKPRALSIRQPITPRIRAGSSARNK